ncbi:MAG: DinB family protein [Fimbriimonadaceae bacterium]
MAQEEFLSCIRHDVVALEKRLLAITEGRTDEKMTTRDKHGHWSMCETIHHMIQASEGYPAAIEKAIEKTRYQRPHIGAVELSTLGKLIIKHGGPGGNAPAPSHIVPKNDMTRDEVVGKWVEVHHRLSEVTKLAESIDIVKTEARSPIFKLISLRLADAFEILVMHSERHIQQLEERYPR